MKLDMSNKCFYKNGKRILKKKLPNNKVKEDIYRVNSILKRDEVVSITDLNSKKPSIFNRNRIRPVTKKFYKEKGTLKIDSTRLKAGVTGVWAAFSIVIIFAFLTSIMTVPQKSKPQDTKKYSIYASKPLTIKTTTTSIYSKDSRAQKINEVYKIYNCPMEGLGDVMVYEADKNNIPWWLVASVSFQESGCGKKTPKVGGMETYNAWGWAVYGGMAFSFDNWVRGIETVSKYFSDRFYSRGITDLCEIMKTYTPPSDGSWCKGVNHFGDMIQNYETPLN